MIRMMCGVRLVDRVLTNVLWDRVDVVSKINDMIIQSYLWWCDHVIHRDISSQICGAAEVEITGKKGRRVGQGNCGHKESQRVQIVRREDAYDEEIWPVEIKAKSANLG